MKKILFSTFLIFSLVSVESLSAPPRRYLFKFSKECPKERPFLSKSYGKNLCIGCDYAKTIKIERGYEKDFEICKNRENFTYNNLDYQSRLKECPKEIPLKTVNGCQTCSFQGKVWGEFLTKEMCDLCSGAIYYKNEKNGICSQCPADKPMAKGYEFGESNCKDCNSEMIEFSEDECNKCPNRKYVKLSETTYPKWGCLRKKFNSEEIDIPSHWDLVTDGYGFVYPYRYNSL